MKKHKPVEEMGGKKSVNSWLSIHANATTFMTGVLGVAGFFAYTIVQFNNIDTRFEKIDARFDQIDARFGQIDATLKQINDDLNKTGEVLHADLAWRYFYSSHPDHKNKRPVYDPIKRTIEFVAVDSVTRK